MPELMRWNDNEYRDPLRVRFIVGTRIYGIERTWLFIG
jgi:hypothetical protein